MIKPLLIVLLLLMIPVIHKIYSTLKPATFEQAPIRHLALIMDGNRRWAKKRNQMSSYGHQKGTETVKRLIQYALERKIEVVSVYAFSLENFQRSPEEIKALFKIMIDAAEEALPELVKNGVRVRFIGDKNMFPENVRTTSDKVEKETAQGTKLLMNILFCYGGRQEIVSAVKKIVQDVKDGVLTEAPDEETFKKYLWTYGIPDPDLIIRTGGVKRLSNFLTYQMTYSELYFTDRLWPDLTAKDLDNALKEYSARKRNFGK